MHFRKFIFALLLLPTIGLAQSSTPNIGLQIPATGSNNWYIPLNYNFNKLDQYLSGALAVPAFHVSGNLTVDGTVTASGFNAGGGTFATVVGTPIANNCAKWITNTSLGDAGSICGTSGGSTITLTGDVTGTGTGTVPTTVVKVNGVAVSGTPSAGQVMTASDGTHAAWSNPSASVASSANVNTANTQTLVDSIVSNTAFGLTLFGDSITCQVGVSNPLNGYSNILAADLGIATPNNQCVAGDNGQDMAWHVFSTVSPTSGSNAIFTTMIGTNNHANSAAGIPNFKQAQYASNGWLAMSSVNKILAGNAAVTPTGTTAADTTFALANGVACNTGPCTLSYPATIGQNGVFYVWYLMKSTGDNFTVKVDGGANLTDTVTGSATVTTAWTFAPIHQTVFVGMSRYVSTTGAHTISVSFATGSTIIGFGFPPTFRYRGTSAPKVFMAGVVPELDGLNNSDTLLYNSASLLVSKQLTSDGLNTPFVDVNANLDQHLDFIGTTTQGCTASTNTPLHPNTCGHQHLAQLFESNINGAIPSNGVFNSPFKATLTAPATLGANSNMNTGNLFSTTALNPGLNYGCISSACFGATVGAGAVGVSPSVFRLELYSTNGFALDFPAGSTVANQSSMARKYVFDATALYTSALIQQNPPTASIPSTGYNYSGGTASTTALNPGYCFNKSGVPATDLDCVDTGYDSATLRFNGRIFAPSDHDICMSFYTTGAEPTGQSSFTKAFCTSPNLAISYNPLQTPLLLTAIGTSIASASTISPTKAITHVTGTAAISIITPPSGFIPATVGFTGCIKLIPDGLFTLTTGGNIQPVAGGTVAVVNRVLEVCYDGSQWYPSY